MNLQVHHLMMEASLAEMVFPCRTPLIHPFFNARLRELVGMPQARPLEERKVVLYLSRNSDSGGNGGERQVWRGLTESAQLHTLVSGTAVEQTGLNSQGIPLVSLLRCSTRGRCWTPSERSWLSGARGRSSSCSTRCLACASGTGACCRGVHTRGFACVQLPGTRLLCQTLPVLAVCAE